MSLNVQNIQRFSNTSGRICVCTSCILKVFSLRLSLTTKEKMQLQFDTDIMFLLCPSKCSHLLSSIQALQTKQCTSGGSGVGNKATFSRDTWSLNYSAVLGSEFLCKQQYWIYRVWCSLICKQVILTYSPCPSHTAPAAFNLTCTHFLLHYSTRISMATFTGTHPSKK